MTMRERKQPGRFTVQFNMEDPQQRQVAEELYRQGRRKAQFLTSAVILYTQSPGSAVSAGIDMETLKQVVQEVLRDSSQQPGATQCIPEDAPPEPGQVPNEWDASAADSAFAAMSNTLAAFRQK